MHLAKAVDDDDDGDDNEEEEEDDDDGDDDDVDGHHKHDGACICDEIAMSIVACSSQHYPSCHCYHHDHPDRDDS